MKQIYRDIGARKEMIRSKRFLKIRMLEASV